MSYGEWKSRGKGWAALEIDSKWNFSFDDLDSYGQKGKSKKLLSSLKGKLERHKTWEGYYMGLGWSDNPTEKKFYAYQGLDKGWTIINFHRGAHEIFIAFNPGTIEVSIREYIKKAIIEKTLKCSKEMKSYTTEEAMKNIQTEIKDFLNVLEDSAYDGPVKGMRLQFLDSTDTESMPFSIPDSPSHCPLCNEKYSGFPALSRRDNKTEICGPCGTSEALEDFSNAEII